MARLGEALDQILRRGFTGSRILVLGFACNKNVDDVRECLALSLIELIEGRGATVDPIISVAVNAALGVSR